MLNGVITSRMQESEITDAIKVWRKQHELYCSSNKAFPDYWRNNTREIEVFLNRKVQDGTAIVAKLDNKLIGYLTYDEFPFNGEKSVFCPAIAHAALEEYKEEAYLLLYRSISTEWVNRGVLNHMWTINYNDIELRDILYDLGFGSYLIDAFACTYRSISSNSNCTVEKAVEQDVEILYDLVEESREYYSSAPIFLKREQYSKDNILEIIHKNDIFIAWENGIPIGFINVSIAQSNNIIDLSINRNGLLDEIGAYIKSDYRSKGVGKKLLEKVFGNCKRNNIQTIHVDFETANFYANRFWRKYFNPMLLSVRRTINKNIND